MDLEFRFHAAEQQRWQDVRELRLAKEARLVNAGTKRQTGGSPRSFARSSQPTRSAPRQPA